jgi:ubiquinone/menaquinone biosynthesis C-methylase UbiE
MHMKFNEKNLFFKILKEPKSLSEIYYNKKKNVLKSLTAEFQIIENIPILFNKKKIQKKTIAWWSDLYRQLYEGFDSTLTNKNILNELNLLEDLMKKNKHLLVNEMLGQDIINKTILEIGSGSGAHSAFLKSKGAKICSVDISLPRVISTYKKLSLVNKSSFLCLNCDAEYLPIANKSFDFVYSNGVLHHSLSTTKTVNEIYRVLKPGGKAVIMLYSRFSAEYIFNIIPRALLFGSFFLKKKEAEWIGEVTEGKPKFGKIKNPITRVYSQKQLKILFKDFEIISIRKSSFFLKDFCIPKLTQAREFVLKLFGCKLHSGGKIVYGRSVFPQTKIELLLSPYLGFSWNIVIRKK